jgi:hypothetical protein
MKNPIEKAVIAGVKKDSSEKNLRGITHIPRKNSPYANLQKLFIFHRLTLCNMGVTH